MKLSFRAEAMFISLLFLLVGVVHCSLYTLIIVLSSKLFNYCFIDSCGKFSCLQQYKFICFFIVVFCSIWKCMENCCTTKKLVKLYNKVDYGYFLYSVCTLLSLRFYEVFKHQFSTYFAQMC